MIPKAPRPHGSVTSQRAAGSEFLGRSSDPHPTTVDPEKLAATSQLGAMMEAPLVGLRVRMDRPVDRNRPCCRNICTIGPAKGPHAGELICADCGQHRGWISNATARWIESVIAHFGRPTTPIVVRSSYIRKEKVPAQNDRS
jgi:hypothetical protein